MALPLVPIAAMIARAGISAATKRFGKKAVQEAVKKGAKPRGATRNKPAPKATAAKKPAAPKKTAAAKKPAPKKPAAPKKPRGATRSTGQAAASRRAGTKAAPRTGRAGRAGVAAATVAVPMAASVVKRGEKPVRTVKTKGGDYPVYAKKSDKAASFRKAFAAARKSGKKTFTWDGRKYNTKVK
jgi:histone H1/5